MYLNGESSDSIEPLPRIFIWSAFDEGGIERISSIWQQYFQNQHLVSSSEEDCFLKRLALTLARRRTLLPWRSFVVATSIKDLMSLENAMSQPLQSDDGRGMAFVFSGQGAAYNGMGRKLLVFPRFVETLEAFDAELRQLGCNWSLFGMILLDILKRC